MNQKLKEYKWLILIMGSAIVSNIVAAYAFVQWYLFIDLSSNNAANIGAAIGGITAPIMSLATISLLYLAFHEQFKANQNAKEDIARNLFKNMLYDLKSDINSLSVTVDSGNGVQKVKGNDVYVYLHKVHSMYFPNLIRMFQDLFLTFSYVADALETETGLTQLEKEFYVFKMIRLTEEISNPQFKDFLEGLKIDNKGVDPIEIQKLERYKDELRNVLNKVNEKVFAQYD